MLRTFGLVGKEKGREKKKKKKGEAAQTDMAGAGSARRIKRFQFQVVTLQAL